ncbi:DEAD/DEAH box helicase [Salinibacterium sp. SYSU T00001]|uniref:DEAD/DEAH box helicase n=1 Tax=Homoserinimonas sedimenticola TaxID=2986805 RepID=UPI0022357744|nr:DEAD/DEAH box helicase [Salinibacterium sedimenticola]MCW4386322.1 DEAD/DEAH box helicase [Salinibacterium sedimenticola]
MLAEMDAARELPNGFEIASHDVARLGDDEADVLGLPPIYRGSFDTAVKGHTNSSSFRFELRTRVGLHPEQWKRIGPLLEVGEKRFRLTPPLLRAFEAVETHAGLQTQDRTENANALLIARLHEARDEANRRGEPFGIQLHHFDSWTTAVPDEVSLSLEQRPDGSLKVSPNLNVGVEPSAVVSRLHQIDPQADQGVLRVGKTLVVLDEKRTAAVRDVMQNRRIPASQVKKFLEAPSAFFDASLVNLELGFAEWVKGVGEFVPGSYDDAKMSRVSWFDSDDFVAHAAAVLGQVATLEELDTVVLAIESAWENDHSVATVGETLVDVGDREQTAAAIEEARQRVSAAVETTTPGEVPLEEEKRTVSVLVEEASESATALTTAAAGAKLARDVDYVSLKRSPFPHQREGIEWMARLMQASLAPASSLPRLQGALLADDMGLGKTFMTLVALREFLVHQAQLGEPDRPTLAVLPLSLLENWEAEIGETFQESPFKDVVVLQSDRDLRRFRIAGAGRETVAKTSQFGDEGMLREDAIRFSLRIGAEYGPDRLDMPGRLVLTTYDTARDYQLSMSQIDWGVVVFDEAQNIKVPDALKTRAAKALKARFKLLATGTPIENSLRDLWCLMDTAQPGLLGRWDEFRERWSVGGDDDGLSEIEFEALALQLRDHIGTFMLRRTKADHLTDLPSKTIYSGVEAAQDDGDGVVFDQSLAIRMPQIQQAAYDDRLNGYRSAPNPGREAALAALQDLRAISLHPKLNDPAAGEFSESARLLGAFAVLDRVRDAGEKVIVFVIDRRMQRKVALWLEQRYGIAVSVVNGETKAVSTRGGDTRRSIIREFEAAAGFNVIVMSPLAVGVGLTVVGANHAVLLERHWNPAKEAQAIDRIYRIGQKRPVHVYVPVALHPAIDSFDLHLDSLLRQKTRVKDAVIVPEAVREGEMLKGMGLLT